MQPMTRALAMALFTLACGAASLGARDRFVILSTRAPRGPAPDVRAIRMVDDHRGWTTPETSFWFTDDGGKTWRKAPADLPFGSMPEESWGVTASGEMWALVQRRGDSPVQLLRVGINGVIQQQALPCATVQECQPAAADFNSDGGSGFLFALAPTGDRGVDRILAFKTADGGSHWARVAAPEATVARGDIHAKMVGDAGIAVAVGCDLYTSSDGGGSWAHSAYGGLQDVVCGDWSTPLTIRFPWHQTGWMRTFDGWVIETRDGGASWLASSLGHQHISFPLSSDEWISFADARHGLAVIDGGVLATRDGGGTWQRLNLPGGHFWSVSCAKSRCVLVSETATAEFVFGQ